MYTFLREYFNEYYFMSPVCIGNHQNTPAYQYQYKCLPKLRKMSFS